MSILSSSSLLSQASLKFDALYCDILLLGSFYISRVGWDKLSIKQTAGDAPVCGLSQIDLDYSE